MDMIRLASIFIATVALGFGITELRAEPLTPVTIPAEYLIGIAPPSLATPMEVRAQSDRVIEASSASRERSSAIDGSTYAVVFPIFTGADGNTSYIRLGNGHGIKTSSGLPTSCYNPAQPQSTTNCNHGCLATPTRSTKYGQSHQCGTIDAQTITFTIIVVGSPSGQVYGTGTFNVSPRAFTQNAITDVLSTAKAGPLTGGDTAYTLYISSPDARAFYQHVIYNNASQFFEDLTYCQSGKSGEGSGNVNNVHTSLLQSNFPSTIYLHNYDNVAANYRVEIKDSVTGLLLGAVPSLAANANATYAIPESFFEQQINFTPNSSQYHINIEYDYAADQYGVAYTDTVDAPGDPRALMTASVKNVTLNSVLNLSNKCRIN